LNARIIRFIFCNSEASHWYERIKSKFQEIILSRSTYPLQCMGAFWPLHMLMKKRGRPKGSTKRTMTLQ
jgi:hypothetical protein